MTQTEISKETKEYFSNLKRKILRYNNVKRKAVKYLMDNKIKDQNLISGCITIALLWQASREKESLTEQLVWMYLGIKSEREFSTTEFMTIDESLKDMTLNELLEYTVENF